MSYDQNLADCEVALADLATVVNDQSQKLNAANLETLSWKARAEQNYAEWEEANKLLEQTIEVLEGFPHLGWRFELQSWYRCKAKPLLDNLKALKKEPDVHQQAVAEMLAPKPIHHVDGGFKP